jgi:Ca2+-binding EF-hand superfamily protein
MLSRTWVLTCSAAGVVCLGLASSPVITTVHAQGRNNRAASRMRFQEMDRNNDGVVTRDEWNGSARSFEVHDWNNDGRLSGDEVRVGAQRNMDIEAADHNPNRYERNVIWTRAGFNSLDHNRDGRLTSNEWHFDVETFRRVDSNRDNAVTLAEYLGEGVDDLRDDRFDELDRDNNGRVERTEWYGGLNEFRNLDRNNDGILSRFEVVGAQESFDTYNEFQSLDYDRDGNLARNEWHWSNASFTARDSNRDGRISRAEFETAGGSPDSAGAETAGTQAAGAQAAGNLTVRVNAQTRWTDSGLTVRAGDVITFSSQGQIQMSDNGDDVATPGGARSGRTAPDAPVLNQKAGALIARIGDYSSPLFIGDRPTITAPVSGRLYLGVNDDHLPDNRGEFTVTVGLQGRTRR